MITMNNNILNSPTSLSEVIDNKIKIFANDIDNSDNFNPKQVDILMRTSYLLTKLSLINTELQTVENEIISIQKSDYYAKENIVFNKMLKEEIKSEALYRRALTPPPLPSTGSMERCHVHILRSWST